MLTKGIRKNVGPYVKVRLRCLKPEIVTGSFFILTIIAIQDLQILLHEFLYLIRLVCYLDSLVD